MPGVMGGEVCILDSRIPVWLMVSYRRMGSSGAEILENYPTLSAQDLMNAWRYAVEIDRYTGRRHGFYSTLNF
jgi:uncharacterized protein (DUF433 family)